MLRQNSFGLISRLPVKTGNKDTRKSRSTSRPTTIPTNTGQRNSRLSNTESSRSSQTSRSASRTPRLHVPSSIRSRSLSGDKRSIKKDSRPISEKTWQAAQVAKTQKYLRDIGGSEFLNNGTNLRPLTLKMFVHIINFLLEPVSEEKEPLTVTNYVEKLPVILNTLMYPGIVSASILKTANTMHSWPSVLAILCWLVDINKLVCDSSDEDHNSSILDEEKPIEEQILQIKLKASLEAYKKFNKEEPTTEVDEWLAKELQRVFNLPENTKEHIEKVKNEWDRKVKERKELAQKDKAEIELLEVDLVEWEKENVNLKEAIQSNEILIENMESAIKNKPEDIEKMEKSNEILCKEVEQRKKTIGKNVAVAEERQKTKDKTTALTGQKQIISEKIKHKEKISDEIDLRLASSKAHLEKKIKQHNLALIEPSLKFPEFEEHLIPEDLVMKPDRLIMMNQKLQKKIELMKKLQKKEELLQQEIKSEQEKSAKVQSKVENDTKESGRKKKIKEIKKRDLEQLKEYIEKETLIIKNSITKEQEVCQNLSNLILKTMSSDIEEKIKVLEQKKDEFSYWQQELPALTQKMVDFFQKLQKHSYEQLSQHDKLLAAYIQNIENYFNFIISEIERNELEE